MGDRRIPVGSSVGFYIWEREEDDPTPAGMVMLPMASSQPPSPFIETNRWYQTPPGDPQFAVKFNGSGPVLNHGTYHGTWRNPWVSWELDVEVWR